MFKSMKSIFNALMVIGILTSSLYSIEVKNGGVSGVNITAPSSKFNNLYIGAGSTVGDGTSKFTADYNGNVVSSGIVNASQFKALNGSVSTRYFKDSSGNAFIDDGASAGTTLIGGDNLYILFLNPTGGLLTVSPTGTGINKSTWTATGLDLVGDLNVQKNIKSNTLTVGGTSYMSGAIRQVNGETIANGTDGFTTFSGAIRTEDGTLDSLGALILATNSNGAVNLRPQGTGDTAVAIDSDTDLIIGGISGTAAAIRSTWTATGLDLTGNLNVTGQVIASSPAFCTFAYNMHGASVTAINAADTYTLLCGTGVMVRSGWFKNVADAAGNNNRITYVGTPTRGINIRISGCIRSLAAQDYVRIALYKGGNMIDPLAVVSPETFANVKDVAFALNWQDVCATNDYYEVWISASDTDDDALDKMQIVIDTYDD